jgi:Uma2 family endonuclease
MGDAARRAATYDDVLAAPEGMTAEILAGELYLSPRPAADHVSIEGDVFGDLRERFGRRRGGPGPGGWWILIEPELHLGDPDPTTIVAVPDIAGWRRERLPEIPRAAAITVAPDWICEVLSPGARNVRRDRIVKPEVYASRGIGHLWLIDPVAQLLEVHRLVGGLYARAQAFSGDVRVRAEPFDAVELDIGAWWIPGGDPD